MVKSIFDFVYLVKNNFESCHNEKKSKSLLTLNFATQWYDIHIYLKFCIFPQIQP